MLPANLTIEQYLPSDAKLLKHCYERSSDSFSFALASIPAAYFSAIGYATKGCLEYTISLIDGDYDLGKKYFLHEGKKSLHCLALFIMNFSWVFFSRRKIAIAPPLPPHVDLSKEMLLAFYKHTLEERNQQYNELTDEYSSLLLTLKEMHQLLQKMLENAEQE